ncbi:MAG: SIS domain-containing protein [Spirochaetes bacterium]|nr:SIS domain-containing protein [Spirochaetota bacterium]
MNLTDKKYTAYALAKEMLQTADVVKKFDPLCADDYAQRAKKMERLFFTGEGSSRIFPAKRAMTAAMRLGKLPPMATDGATQALEYDLSRHAVFGASNSGKTKELVRLFTKLKNEKHPAYFGLVANKETPVEALSHKTHVLSCGKEDAVAATKSVVEQALFYDALLHAMSGKKMADLSAASQAIEKALTLSIDPEITKKLAAANMLYFAGRNTGVAEELTLKTNEITRKKSDYLEGTYAVHGIEEVMNPNEAVIIIEPFASEEEKFAECLVKGVGMTVIAIASRQTSFPTVIIPDAGEYAEYVELCAGWNLLLETGIALGINLDKPVRARKVGNEYSAG